MSNGTPIGRQWLLMLHDGRTVIDWSKGLYQDIASGNFIRLEERDISHAAQDTELAWLKHVGQVLAYDETTVFVPALPERPADTLA
jgi:hypothetical protein